MMSPTLRAELDRIEDFLMGPEGAKLADVLSALRGPDDSNDALKAMTTCLIRTTAFPRLSKQSWYDGVVGSVVEKHMWDFKTASPEREILTKGVSHFRNHIGFAFKALGIEVSDLFKNLCFGG